LPPKRVRIPQVNYTYISERNAQNIFADALASNAIVTGVEENTQPRSDFNNLSRIARSYFKDIPIPNFRIQYKSSLSLSEFIKKEFPHFVSDDRLTIVKNNAKLKQSYTRHEDLLNSLMELLQEKGWRKPRISSKADVLATKGRTMAIFEAKSVTPLNLPHQIRIGITQLYEYSFDLHIKGYHKQNLILLLEKKPESKWFYFCEYCNVELWFRENKRIVTGRS
jgi:hypothetical protein